MFSLGQVSWGEEEVQYIHNWVSNKFVMGKKDWSIEEELVVQVL